MNLKSLTLLSLATCIASLIGLTYLEWLPLLFPFLIGFVCFFGCLFLLFLRAIGASGHYKGSATEFSQINFDVEKSTRIKRTGLISMIAPLIVVWVLTGIASWLLGSWVIWGGVALTLFVLVGLAISYEGTCPTCGKDNFEVAEAAELGIPSSQLKGFQQSGTVSSLRMTSQKILRCECCQNWIVVKTDTGQAIEGNSRNLPFVRRWNSILPSSGFRLPSGCICCGEQARHLEELMATNTEGRVTASEGVGFVASMAGGSFVGKLASAAVEGVQDGMDNGAKSVSLSDIPVCDKHRGAVGLKMNGNNVYMTFPTFEAKQRVEGNSDSNEIVDAELLDATHSKDCTTEAGTTEPHCGHREHDPTNFSDPVKECSRTTEAQCVSCMEGRCSTGWHTYLAFCTITPGNNSPFDANTKFFYWCDDCQGPVCVRCLDLEDDYPCPFEELMSFPFHCPSCYQAVRVVATPEMTEEGVADFLIECVANNRCP